MPTCFTQPAKNSIAIKSVTSDDFSSWQNQQPEKTKNWISAVNFTAKPETFCLIPDDRGQVSQVLLGVKDNKDFWSFGVLPTALTNNIYHIDGVENQEQLSKIFIAWGLGAYQFTRYKPATKQIAQLVIPEKSNNKQIEDMVNAIYLVRDLINTPTEDMGPEQLAQVAINMGDEFGANVAEIIGDKLLENNYPLIHAVGRGSRRAPRLIDLAWGHVDAPKVTLVGKGVCFDSGGYDIKNAAGMILMKKDMGGAAHVLGLAQMIMSANLPVRLRVLIPAVENLISGNAFKPGDVLKSRHGLTVEIGNTDAEGRLVLADALAEAVVEKPELLLDFATLTGAARIAVGTEISALFSNNDELAKELVTSGLQQQDPIWHLPLYSAYRKMLDSAIADINNSNESGYAGAITAALFLKEFVPDEINWAHFDLMAWNLAPRSGRPIGGEAMALRSVFAYLQVRFGK